MIDQELEPVSVSVDVEDLRELDVTSVAALDIREYARERDRCLGTPNAISLILRPLLARSVTAAKGCFSKRRVHYAQAGHPVRHNRLRFVAARH
jgi:hypothetical protein